MDLLNTIRAEIERRRDKIIASGQPCLDVLLYDELLSFLGTLEQPSLPEGLDEAARFGGMDYVDTIPDGGTPKHPWNDHDVERAYEEGMKAGASWMAGQKTDPFSPVQPGPGYGSYATTKIGAIDDFGFNYEEEVVLDEDGFPCIKTINFHDYDPEKPLFKPGDKVIVQIRKK